MIPDTAGKITPNDKLADMQPHLANMSKSISGNFKGVASDIAASGQQQQPITLSRESIAALGKLLPFDNMSGIKQPELTKDSKNQPISDEVIKNMQMQSKAMLEGNKDPKEKSKENLVSTENKIPDINANQSKVQTDMFKSLTDTILPGFMNKLPSIGDLGKTENKVPDINANQSKVQPDMLKSLTDTLLPGFMNKLPSIGDLGKKADEATNDPKELKDMLVKTVGDDFKNLFGLGDNKGKSDAQIAGSAANENLLKEVQTLNKQTAELVKYMKATLDENKTQTSKLGSLSGNLYV